MEPPEHRLHNNNQNHQHQPNLGFIKLLSLKSDTLSDCLLSLTSPFLSLLSLASTAFRRPEDIKVTEDDSADSAAPSTSVNGSSILLKKAVLGFVGAAYVCLVLTTVMAFSAVVGVCLVQRWVEEPVHIQQKLYFDYTNVHPSAVLDFGFEGHYHQHHKLRKIVPVGHNCNIRLVIVMPESDYNREIGMFQVVASSFSSNGDVISSSSFPCMLRFRSQPIRAMHTFLMGAPLLLGITSEIQTINMPLLKYKEHNYPRTQSIKVTLVPRAGMPFLPQIYEAKLIMISELPWIRRLVRNWKWTFSVWISLYIYLMLVLVLVCFFRSVMFPIQTTISAYQRVAVSDDLVEEPPQVVVSARDRPTSEALRRWRQSRSKRKAMLLGEGFLETSAGSEATSISVTRDGDISVTTEEVGDSESYCQ